MKLKKSHKCENTICENIASKDKYGNYRTYCSNECKIAHTPNKYKSTYAIKDKSAILEKRKATNLAKYGVTNVAQTDSVKNKLRITSTATADIRTAKTIQTNLERYGVESTNSLQSVKDKKKESFMEKYGVDHQLKIPEIAASVSRKNSENAVERLAIARQTKLEIYGDEHYNNREKYVDTCIEKFGVENPSQNVEVHAKKMTSQYRTKEFIFPSGRITRMQGYECKALKELLSIYPEDDIITDTMSIPSVSYIGTDGKKHVYFPDIYIPKDNLFIEVKSQYTFDGFIGWYETNKLKEKACFEAGYNFKFMIMAKK